MKRCDFKLDGFSCAEEAISAYIDGELSENESKKLEEHIKNCSECAETLARYRGFKAEIEKMEYEVPDDLHERIMNGIKDRIKTGNAVGKKKITPTLSRRIGLWCGAGVADVLCLSLIASPLFKKAFSLDENSAYYAVGDADMLNYGAYMKSPSDSDVDCASPAEAGANGACETDGTYGAECAEAKGANGNFDVIWFDDSGDAEDRAADGGENDVFDSPAQIPEFSSDCLKFSMINSSLCRSYYNDLCLNVLEYPETTADKIPEYEHLRGSLD